MMTLLPNITQIQIVTRFVFMNNEGSAWEAGEIPDAAARSEPLVCAGLSGMLTRPQAS